MRKRIAALVLTLALAGALGAPLRAADGATDASSDGPLALDTLRQRMRAHYYPLLALEESIAIVEALDYDELSEELREGLNTISSQEAAIAQIPIIGPFIGGAVSGQLQSQYDALREQYDAIKNGKMQADNAGAVHQLRTLQDQTVMMGETLALTLAGLEQQDAALTRTLDKLARTEREMTLRCEMGQISELTLHQIATARTQAASGQQTLRMNMENLRRQLRAMTGLDEDAALTLAPVPAVTQEQLAAMDEANDLARAEAASYELYDAQKKRDDAEETYQDAVKEYGALSTEYGFVSAQHTRRAAEYTYLGTVQNYELKFRTLYAQVKDDAQALAAARAALGLQEASHRAAALKYEQGSISHNALLDAADELADARDAAATAERTLYTDYHRYEWAVERGILN